jgi:serine protease
MRPNPLLTATLVAACPLAVATPGGAAVVESADPVDGQYIVVVKPDAVRARGAAAADLRPSLPELADEMASRHRGELGHRYGAALAGFVFRGGSDAAEELAADPRVVYVAEDSWVRVTAEQVAPASWGLDRADQRDAALDARYAYYADGAGIDVYLVDSGLRASHADFGGRIGAGFTALQDGNGTDDCLGHGTHVAGIVGGATYGVAKAVTLHPVRVIDCAGYGRSSDIVAGIDWITARYPTPTKKGAVKPPTRAVANLSFATTWQQVIDDAVANSVKAGVTYVVAAGNGGSDSCIVSPARVASAITVGASDRNDARAAFSNLGSCVDLFAPGEAIVSSFAATDTDALAMSGTSMAAPHVAGTAALLLSVNPNLSPAQVALLLESNASAGALANPGTGSPNLLLYSPFTGAGIDSQPAAEFTASCVTGTCSFDARVSADDRGIASWFWSFGNGKTGSGQTISHRYARTTKSATVTLTVTDTIGQTASYQLTVATGN